MVLSSKCTKFDHGYFHNYRRYGQVEMGFTQCFFLIHPHLRRKNNPSVKREETKFRQRTRLFYQTICASKATDVRGRVEVSRLRFTMVEFTGVLLVLNYKALLYLSIFVLAIECLIRDVRVPQAFFACLCCLQPSCFRTIYFLLTPHFRDQRAKQQQLINK